MEHSSRKFQSSKLLWSSRPFLLKMVFVPLSHLHICILRFCPALYELGVANTTACKCSGVGGNCKPYHIRLLYLPRAQQNTWPESFKRKENHQKYIQRKTKKTFHLALLYIDSQFIFLCCVLLQN